MESMPLPNWCALVLVTYREFIWFTASWMFSYLCRQQSKKYLWKIFVQHAICEVSEILCTLSSFESAFEETITEEIQTEASLQRVVLSHPPVCVSPEFKIPTPKFLFRCSYFVNPQGSRDVAIKRLI